MPQEFRKIDPGEDPAEAYAKTSRAQVRKWVQEKMDEAIEGGKPIHTPTLIDEAMLKFQKDDTFIQSLLRERLQATIGQLVQEKISQTRSYLRTSDGALPREEIRRMAQDLSKRWERWVEHVGDMQVPILSMTKEHLVAAETERKGHASRHLRMAALWRTLHPALKEGQKVGDVFTIERIEEIYQSLEGEE